MDIHGTCISSTADEHGSMTKNLLSSFPELNVHAVEYREAVVKTAKEHFHLPDTHRLFIHIDDAANHIKNT
ncbi:MAG: hypothetical protein Q9N67_10640, partial [Ghiorsea sp.]|nr:hypothetical protein [Ghiorsea sp.]